MTNITTSSSSILLAHPSYSNPVSISSNATLSTTFGNAIAATGPGWTVVNSGDLASVFDDGIGFADGGSVTQTASGTISGSIGVFLGDVGTASIHGIVIGTGGTAVAFGGTGSNLMTVYSDAVFSGTVAGGASATNTLELASSASTGTVSGLGTSFVNFQNINVDSASNWVFAADNSAGYSVSFLTDSGTITNTGTLTGVVTLDSGGVLTNASGGIIGNDTFAVRGSAAGVSVLNSGSIIAASYAILLAAGGTVTNVASGAIFGFAGIQSFGPLTLANSGTINGSGLDGVYVGGEGVVSNATSAVVYGSGYGIYVADSATIQNQGTVIGSNDYGIEISSSGSITNAASGTISGGGGIHLNADGGTLLNQGTIIGTASDGVKGKRDAVITNAAGALISGTDEGVFIGGGGTLMNAGTIDSNTTSAVDFYGTGSNLLVIAPGAVFGGAVTAPTSASNTMELTPGPMVGTLSGLGTSFTNFGTIEVDAAARWTLASANTIASATLINAGTVMGGVTLGTGGVLTNAATGIITSSGVSVGATQSGATLTNAGAILSQPAAISGIYVGVAMSNGGSIFNASTGTIAAGFDGIEFITQAGSVYNAGHISANRRAGIDFVNGGTLTNTAQAVITGGAEGVDVLGAAAAILNQGTISGTNTGSVGVGVVGGGTVTNAFGARISGVLAGVGGSAVSFGLINYGTITGTTFAVIGIAGGNTIVNDASAQIAGEVGIFLPGGGSTVIQSGTVVALGGTAVAFGGTSANLMVLHTGAVETGIVAGSTSGLDTLELDADGGASGSINGLGVSFKNFGTIVVDQPAPWAVYGYNTIASGVQVIADNSLYVENTLTNSGTIVGGAGVGIRVGSGGTLTNATGGSITGAIGVKFANMNSGMSVANFGAVTGTAGQGIELEGSSTLTNEADGQVSGSSDGVDISGSGMVSNAGTIESTDTSATGVFLASGTVMNGAAGYILGGTGVIADGQSATLVNAGTIVGVGGTAVYLGGYGSNLLVMDPGAVFTGMAVANATATNAIELTAGGGAGTIAGLGTSFVNFQTVSVDAGANWTFAGSNSASSSGTIADYGTLTNNGTLNATVTLEAGGTLSNGIGGTVATTGVAVTGTAADALLINGGVIESSGTYGAQLGASGVAVTVFLVNEVGGTITGTAGLSMLSTAEMYNAGVITGTTGDGAYLAAGGVLTNAGTITGADGVAVRFEDTYASRLVLKPGAVFDGLALGSTSATNIMELASAGVAGTVTGLGYSFVNFGSITVDAGQDWVVTGTNVVASQVILTDYGSLSVAGTLTNDGTIVGETDGESAVTVVASGALTNYSTITGGVSLAGGTLTNAAEGTISTSLGYGVAASGAGPSTIINLGRITGLDNAVYMADGGLISNAEGALISGANVGVVLAGNPGTVLNAGTIMDSSEDGIRLDASGSVSNSAVGVISGHVGIVGNDGAATIVNLGTIVGTSGAGVKLNGGGATVVNDGTIAGGGTLSVYLGGNSSNLLVVAPGAAFVGTVSGVASIGNVLELTSAGTVGTLTGLGTSFANFATIEVDAGAQWAFDDSDIVATATLINSGTVSGAVMLGAGGVVTNTSTGLIAGSEGVTAPVAMATVTNEGVITGVTSGIDLALGGAVLNLAGATITGAEGISLGSAGFVGNYGGTIIGTGGTAVAFGGTGSNTLAVDGNAVFSGLAMGGVGAYNQLDLNASSGTISGLGTEFVGFTLINEALFGNWTLAGNNTVGAGVQVKLGEAGYLTLDGTLSNAGVVTYGNLLLGAGSVMTNAVGGIVSNGSRSGVTGIQTGVTFVNQGTVEGVISGVSLGLGGIIANAENAAIEGGAQGVYIRGGTGTIANAGLIVGAAGAGVSLEQGGYVTNSAAGTLVGGSGGAYGQGAVTVVNEGVIRQSDTAATAGIGLQLRNGGFVSNAASGYIEGGIGVNLDLSTASTLINAGTIVGAGGTAVYLGDFGGNLLVVDPGAVFTGAVYGSITATNVLELASGSTAGTLTGLGTSFTGFSTITVDSGARWTLTGDNSPGSSATITDAGSLTNEGTLNATVTLQIDGSLFNAVGATVTSSGVAVFSSQSEVGLANYGVLASSSQYGVQLGETGGGGTFLINLSGGSITGTGGVQLLSNASMVNLGVISGTVGDGVALVSGGALVDNGTIIGANGTAVGFGGTGSNLIAIGAGAAFTGTVVGSASATNTILLEGYSGPGTLSGLGVSFTNFANITVASDATWTLTGDNTVASPVFMDDGTVVNAGTLDGAVTLGVGAVFTNASGASITADVAVYARWDDARVVNAGSISATYDGVGLGGTGQVTNLAGGVIQGRYFGVDIYGLASVVNAGLVSSEGYGVQLVLGGQVTNQLGGIIQSSTAVAVSSYDAATVVNHGSIVGLISGTALHHGGSVSNAADGIVYGGTYGVVLQGDGTVTNAGTITGGGGTAVALEGTTQNRLVLGGGAVFGGLVVAGAGAANVMELGSIGTVSSGAVTGLGVSFENFGSITVDAGQQWQVYGYNSIGSAVVLTDYGYLSVFGTLTNAGTIVGDNPSSSAISVADTGTLTNDGTIAGGVELTGGRVINALTGTITGSQDAIGGDSDSALTVINKGLITGGTDGVHLTSGGFVSNAAGALISGTASGIVMAGSSDTVLNAGTISGANGTAIAFGGYGSNRLIIAPDATFEGNVVGSTQIGSGNTIELASATTAGLLSGVGSSFSNFARVEVDLGAVWTMAGTNSGAFVTDYGTLINTGTIAKLLVIEGVGALATNTATGTIGRGVDVYHGGAFLNEGTVLAVKGDVPGVELDYTGTVTNTVSGYINADSSGVYLYAFAGTVTNSGTIVGGSNGVYLQDGGILTNAASGSISSEGLGVFVTALGGTVFNDGIVSAGSIGVSMNGAAGTVSNTGTVIGATAGIILGAGGLVSNAAGGLVSGVGSGVNIRSVAGTVLNQGSIETSPTGGYGIDLAQGGSVTNSAGGQISGYGGVIGRYGPLQLLNMGTITGNGGAGVSARAGSVTNVAGAVISGESYGGVYLADGTLTNAGTIIGTSGYNAVYFWGDSPNLLVIDPGAVFVGDVSGSTSAANTMELASAANVGTIEDIGTSFTNFSTVTVDPGAVWELDGANTLAAGSILTNSGTLTLHDAALADAGSAVNDGTIVLDPSTLTLQDLTGTGVVSIAAGSTLSVAGAISVAQSVNFTGGGNAFLILGNAPAVAGTIGGFSFGDTIDVADLPFVSAQSTVVVAGNELAATEGSTTFTFATAGLADGTAVYSVADGMGGTDLIFTPPSPSGMALAASSDSGVQGDDLTNVSLPTISGVTTPFGTIDLYQAGVLVGTGTADGSGAWSVTTSTALSSGANSFTTTVTDVAGHTSPLSTPLVVTLDLSVPIAPGNLTLAPASDSGTPGDDVTNVALPTITGTAAANTTIDLYDAGSLIGTGTTDGTGHWSIVATTSLVVGGNALTAMAISPAGNVSPASSSLTVTLETVADAPTALTLAPASDSGTSGDDLTDVTLPTITGTADPYSTIGLYDGGSLIGTGTADNTGHWSVIATGSLAIGPNVLTATATDVAGNVSPASSPLTVTLDTTAPGAPGTLTLAPTSDSGTAGDDLTNVMLPTITGTAEAYSTIDLYDGGSLIGTGTADGTGYWAVTATTSLGAGPNVLTATAADAAGNISAASSSLTVTLDTTAPNAPGTLTLAPASDSGVKGDDITNVAFPIIRGTAQAYTTIDLYDAGSLIGTGTTDAEGHWSVLATTSLAVGGNALTATATDSAGNVSAASSSLTVTLETAAAAIPSGLNLAPASDSGTQGDNLTDVTLPTITGTAEAYSTVTLYNGDSVVGTGTADGTGHWSVTATASLAIGPNVLTATAADVAGNMSVASSSLTVTLDTTAPGAPGTLTLAPASDSGIQGDDLTNVALPTITGTAEAYSTIDLYDGGSLIGTGTADGTGHWAVTATTSLGAVPNVLTATAADAAGNISAASSSLTVTLDATAPNAPGTLTLAPASDSGTKGDGQTSINTPVILGTGVAGDIVTLYDGDTLVGTGTVSTAGTWSVTPASALSEGTHSLIASQTSPAGNVSAMSSPFALDIDTIAPSAPTLMQTAIVTGTAKPTLIGLAEAGATVTIYDGAAVLGFVTADATGAFSFADPIELSIGNHVLTATAADSAGNVSASSAALAVNVSSDNSYAVVAPPDSNGDSVTRQYDSGGTLTAANTFDSSGLLVQHVGVDATIRNIYDSDGKLIGTVAGPGSADGVPPQPDFSTDRQLKGAQTATDSGASVVTLLSENNNISIKGNDTILAGAGSTTVSANGNSVLVAGGAGSLTFAGGSGSSTVTGGTGSSVVFGGSGGGIYKGGSAGHNVLVAGDGNTTLLGGGAGDLLLGSGSGEQVILGNAGQQTLVGGGSAATLVGAGAGKNQLWAGSGDDEMFASSGGADTLVSGAGNSVIVAQHGDVVFAAQGTSTVFGSVTGNDVIVGGGNALIVGGNGQDVYAGGAGTSTLFSGSGDDAVFTGSGTMLAVLGAGRDNVFMGSGTATVFAGSGKDIFAAFAGQSGGNTVIAGFKQGTDLLGLGGYDLTTVTQTATKGATVLTLSDNTKITLLGIGHLDSSSIF